MHHSRQLFLSFILLVSAATQSCGAPTKTASDVSGIFRNQEAIALSGIITNLCQNIRARTSAPSMARVSLTDEECAQAGKNADNYRLVEKSFYFEGLTNDVDKISGQDVLKLRARAKVWLNQNILDLAVKLSKALKEREAGGHDLFAKPPTGGNDSLEKLIKLSTKELKKVEINQQDRSFSGALNISGSGIVSLNNDIEIHGQILSDAIAVSVNSMKSADFKDSILKDVDVLVLVKPYAKDVYVDIVFQVNIHSIGLNSTLSDKIYSALGSGLKTALDALLKLR